ncbi:MAG: benzoate-CoA ligase family protein [Deferrisomatales bacterium]|nr:benzoate-CoA ligase family protein [Deferrisomatales bacterium]
MREIETPERVNAASFLLDRHLAEGRGDNVALVCRESSYTYREVQAQVNRLGNGLRDLGVEIENRVLLLSPDVPELVFGLLACMKIGAVPIAANVLLPPEDIGYILQDSRAKVAIAHDSLAPVVQGLRPSLPHLCHLVVIGAAGDGQRGYRDLVDGSGEELAPADTRGDDAAVWQYSSGTTGAPKGIIQMHKNVLWYYRAYAEAFLGVTERDRFLSVAKLFFGYGQGNSLYISFGAGATTILMPDRPEPRTIAELITRERPTVFAGVPTAYNALLQLPDLTEAYDFRSVRLFLSAGEALPPAVQERWREAWGTDIVDGIGCTECFHIFISNRPGDVVPGASGRLVPGFDARLVDEEEREVGPGEIGNLLIRAGCVASGYWGKHRRSQRTFLGEWVKTGDKFSRDEDGLFRFAGRGDDMIKSGGIWVAPVEVEATLSGHPAVLECGVVGAPDPDNLIKPKAFVVLREGWSPSGALTRELQQFVKVRIAPYKYPRWIEYLPKLPKTATGKIQRYKLRGATIEAT